MLTLPMDSSRQYLYAMAAFIFLGLMGWYYAQSPTVKSHQNSQVETPDAIVKGLNFTQYDKQGKRSKVVFTPEMHHFNKNNSNVFEHPLITLYREQEAPWTIKAWHGKSIDGSNKITLWKNVVLYQAASANNPERMVTTDKLNYYPNKQYADTEQEVQIQQAGLLVKSKGMHAYLDKDTIELLDHVRGRYEPSSSAKS